MELGCGSLTKDKVVIARGFHKLLHTAACAAQVSSSGYPDGSIKFIELIDMKRLDYLTLTTYGSEKYTLEIQMRLLCSSAYREGFGGGPTEYRRAYHEVNEQFELTQM